MAYNKAKAEREWLLWKEAEEKKLRTLGVDEGTIQYLRQYDWQMFKSDRKYYEWMQETDTLLDFLAADEPQPMITTVEDLLENIENPHLYQALILTDRLTLQIILWRMEGYSSKEISELCGLTVEAINFRMWHLRKKLKKILGAYTVKGKEYNLSAHELIELVKNMNEVFAKIQKVMDRFIYEEKKENDPYYYRLIRYDFCNFNQIYDNELLRNIGKVLLPF